VHCYDKHLSEESYDKALFAEKRDNIFELTLDLAINHLQSPKVSGIILGEEKEG